MRIVFLNAPGSLIYGIESISKLFSWYSSSQFICWSIRGYDPRLRKVVLRRGGRSFYDPKSTPGGPWCLKECQSSPSSDETPFIDKVASITLLDKESGRPQGDMLASKAGNQCLWLSDVAAFPLFKITLALKRDDCSVLLKMMVNVEVNRSKIVYVGLHNG
jgi:hypothetical protein